MSLSVPSFTYQCPRCHRVYPGEEMHYTCPHDGSNLDIVLDYATLRTRLRAEDVLGPTSEPSQWRYLPLLPVADPGGHGTPLRRVGWTPLYRLPRLREAVGLQELYFKDDSPNPTASFKDRASALVVAHARQMKAQVVITASTGNAGAALAGMAASQGVRAVILAPRRAPEAKIAQLLIYGARVVLVDGTYDDAFELSVQAAQALGWYCRNTGYNPFTTEGKKTAGLEIWEQLLRHDPRPQRWHLFVPVGDGNIISGVYKGLWDLRQLGWLSALPHIHGVQAQGSAAIARAWAAGTDDILPVQAHTLADSIAVDLPRDGYRALRAVRATQGRYWVVTDEAILDALAQLGRHGLFVEPAAAAAFAGLLKAREHGFLDAHARAIVLLTGSGLKDVRAARRAVSSPPVIAPGDVKGLRDLLISGGPR